MAPLNLSPLLGRIFGSRETEPQARVSLIDPLTRLPTRPAVINELKRCLAKSHQKHPVALAIVDFSNVQGLVENGEYIGPGLLSRLAQLMTSVAPDHTVGHLRDREFAVILTDVSVTEAEHLANQIIDAVRSDASLAAERRYIATFVGIGYSSVGDRDAQQLMGLADVALRYALATGRGCHVIVDQVTWSKTA